MSRSELPSNKLESVWLGHFENADCVAQPPIVAPTLDASPISSHRSPGRAGHSFLD